MANHHRAPRPSARRGLQVDLAFNPFQPRDRRGRWTDTAISNAWIEGGDVFRKIKAGDPDVAGPFEEMLKRQPRASQTLYRGETGVGAGLLRPGAIVTRSTPISGTTSLGTAIRFGREREEDRPTIFRINTRAARLLPGQERLGTMREAIIPPGQFRVTGVGTESLPTSGPRMSRLHPNAARQATIVDLEDISADDRSFITQIRSGLPEAPKHKGRTPDFALSNEVDLAFNPSQPRDARGRWVRLPGAASVKAAAERLSTTATSEEPIITGALLTEAEKNPGFLGGFAFRLKTEDSLERKIASDARDEFRGDVTAAATNIKDANRYTLLYTNDHVMQGARAVLADLQRKGFHATKTKDFFSHEGPLGYRGINVQMRTPGGQPWELQFHTPTSFEAKNGEGHRLYEEYRASRNPKRKRALAAASYNFYRNQVQPIVDIGLANHFDPNQPRDPHTGQWIPTPGNIVKRFGEATAGEHEAGQKWYPSAHKTAIALSKKYGVSVQEAAGLLATYSPQTPWGRNQVEAAETLRYGHGIGGPKAAVWFTHNDPNIEDRVGVMATGVTRKLADAVLGGADFDEATAGRNKNGTFKPKALKVRNFYHLIENGGQADPNDPHVVIDRHAMSVALGHRLTDEEYGQLNPGGSYAKYAPYVKAYVDAAKELTRMEGREVTPEEVQATTWLVQQRKNQELATAVGRTRKKLGNKDWAEWTGYAARYLGLNSADSAAVGYSELSRVLGEDIDLANPNLMRTRRVTRQLLDGEDARTLLTRRGVSREVADALVSLVDSRRSGAVKGTATRPNARLDGDRLTTAHRVERDREALYRGAYLLKASERMQAAVDKGVPLRDVLQQESVYYNGHEAARRARLDSVTRAQREARSVGTPMKDPHGASRTLVGWYRDPSKNNDPECLAADGNNFYAEEGTMIGFPGGVHLGCGCSTGPAHADGAMVNDVLRGAVPLEHIAERPRYSVARGTTTTKESA